MFARRRLGACCPRCPLRPRLWPRLPSRGDPGTAGRARDRAVVPRRGWPCRGRPAPAAPGHRHRPRSGAQPGPPTPPPGPGPGAALRNKGPAGSAVRGAGAGGARPAEAAPGKGALSARGPAPRPGIRPGRAACKALAQRNRPQDKTGLRCAPGESAAPAEPPRGALSVRQPPAWSWQRLCRQELGCRWDASITRRVPMLPSSPSCSHSVFQMRLSTI